MNTEVPQRRSRRRGGSRKRGQPCIREGCQRKVRPGDDRAACCYLCAVVAQELERAERMCRATGDTEHWAATVALNDALTDYYRSDLRIYRAALEVGITDERWQAIKRGN